MLSRFFEAPERIKAIRNGPSGALIEGFADYLFHSGYAEVSARRHIRSAEHVACWARKSSVSLGASDVGVLERFGSHLKRCRCGRYSRAHPVNILTGVRLYLRYLQGQEPAVREAAPVDPEPALLQAFCEWMREHRGSSERTLYNYSMPIRELLRRLGEDPSEFDARGLRDFVLVYSRSTGWAGAKQCTTGLRMFLRFLIAESRCRAGLLGAIPVLAHWRLASLPRYLPPQDVERLIDSCEQSLPTGKRNRAILLLLARLGLRAGDIVQLQLDDIDWVGAWIHVSGKSRRQTRLPLTQEVGGAIAAYVQDGRPRTAAKAVFIRSRAPFRALGSHAAVSVLVASAMDRAGINRPGRGAAHLLRHSIASSMLRRGASLQDISALLRHRSIETTQIYAKIDVNALQQIAQPWSEVPSC